MQVTVLAAFTLAVIDICVTKGKGSLSTLISKLSESTKAIIRQHIHQEQ